MKKLNLLIIILVAVTSINTLAAQCVANFTSNSGINGTVNFSDLSTGHDYVVWDFGDGTILTTFNNVNTSHTYNSNGAYAVCITIGDSMQTCATTFCDSVLVTNAITCNLNIPYYTVDSICDYYFTANNTGTSYFWNFGDGNTSTQQNPVHNYTNNGWYYYCLTIDSCPAICDSIYVNCNTAAPCSTIANFNVIDNGGGNYTFNNTSSGGSLAYYWYFGDGYTSTAANPSHTYSANGVYSAILHVYDLLDSNCYDYSVQTINVTGVSNPIACQAGFIVYPDSSNPGNVIVVNNSTGNNLFYYWAFGDGNTSNQQFPNYTYSSSGPFELCLTVFDSISQCSSTYCDSIFSGGTVLKQGGFTINVVPPSSTAINEEVAILNEVATYPNPIKNNLTIDVDLAEQALVEITVVDLLGNEVAIISNEVLNSGNNKLNWNTSNVSNGVYLLNVKTEDTLKVKKLVVNK